MSRLAWAPLLGLAAAKLLLHLATAAAYGFHRDELYYLTGGRHLAFGYVDHPPLVPWLARLSEELFGLSLRGLHLWPALAGACLVLLTGWLACRLGGGAWAQALAATATLLCPMYLAANSKFQTVTFDQLVWGLALAVLLEILLRDDPRLWLAFAVVAALGMLVKSTFLVLGTAAIFALTLTPWRRHLRGVWIWVGGALALLLLLPHLIWQVRHDWPTLEFIAATGVRHRSGPVDFLGRQLLQAGPFSFPLLVGVLVLFLTRRSRRWQSAESLLGGPSAKVVSDLSWLTVAGCVIFLATGGKSYYAGPIYVLLFVLGAVTLEPRFLARSPRQPSRLLRAAPFLLLLGNLAPLPVLLPVLPPEVWARNQHRMRNDDFAEMFGWHELVEGVGTAYRALPSSLQAEVGIYTSNYGSASALDLFGGDHDLPPAASAHNSYYFWSRSLPLDPIIAVGFERDDLTRRYAEVKEIGVVTNRFDVDNEEFGRPIFLCRGLDEPEKDLWPRLRHYD